MAKLHLRDLRLRNNAGMDFPSCYANARLLDCDKGRLATTGNKGEVTCANCRRIIEGEKRGWVNRA